MTDKTKIIAMYAGVVAVGVAVFFIVSGIRKGLPKPDLVKAVRVEKAKEFFPIVKDLEGVNQDGAAVKLSDLKGKVWVVAEFFAVCPHCAARNGAELGVLAKEFAGNPDFHIVCISIDPKSDNQERLQAYAKALGADSKSWWFMNAGDEQKTHEYMEKTLKFFGVRERTNPDDIATNGRFAHDLSFELVNRNMEVVGKWPLAEARGADAKQRDPGLYDRMKAEMEAKIREELAKKP